MPAPAYFVPSHAYGWEGMKRLCADIMHLCAITSDLYQKIEDVHLNKCKFGSSKCQMIFEEFSENKSQKFGWTDFTFPGSPLSFLQYNILAHFVKDAKERPTQLMRA